MFSLPSSNRVAALAVALSALTSRPVAAQQTPSASRPETPAPRASEEQKPQGETDSTKEAAAPPKGEVAPPKSKSEPAPSNAEADGADKPGDAPVVAPNERAPTDAGSTPVPPQLKQGAEPSFPEAARQAGLTEGHVTLKVRVGVDGKVAEATVVESAGYGFDEAAQTAALQHVFEPASVNGSPVVALILLRIDFHAPTDTAPVTSPTSPTVTPPPATATTPGTSAPATNAMLPEGSATTPGGAASPTAAPAAGTAPVESATPDGATPVEVTIEGQSAADRLRRSAEAVNVVEMHEAKRHTQDLGEVLARTQGVAVQRSSGLGSDTRIFMNGLTDDQIRFFLDGIPLDYTGYPFGIANVPVNLVNRVEVYRGVVPVRFGADALGGAINLVSEDNIEDGAHGAASLQMGSFGTYRGTVNSHYRDEARGWQTRMAAFLDLAKNDYPMNIEVPDASGQDVEARVYRFHDGYRALGANAEAGVFDKAWAKRFSVKGFVSDYSKDVQHNLLMEFSPYGDVTYGQFAAGGTVNYEQVFLKQVAIKVVAGYGYRHLDYSDMGECVYNWFGQCTRERGQPGEVIGRAQYQDYWEHNAFGRVNVDWRPHAEHALHLSLAPSYTTRTGEEHRMANPNARDPLSAERKLGGLVTGLEYQVDVLDGDLENRLFVKDYLQILNAEDPLSNGVDFRRKDRTNHRLGVGDGLRYSLLDWLYAKASYEWATRLPRPDEIFGDAVLVGSNLDLRPELSHNINLGFTVDEWDTPAGQWRADVNGFVREVHDLIRLLQGANETLGSYRNISDARSLGAEAAVGWTSVGQYVALDGNAMYVDFRNTSKDGPDARYEGDRIPNRPYLFATGTTRFQLRSVATPSDELSLTWTSRYVQSFFRGWESVGTGKSVVPNQLLHSLALTYAVEGQPMDLSFSSELQNITDAEAYDYFGVPKPGRAVYFKMTSSL